MRCGILVFSASAQAGTPSTLVLRGAAASEAPHSSDFTPWHESISMVKTSTELAGMSLPMAREP